MPTAALAYYGLQKVIIRDHGTRSVVATAVGRDVKGKLSSLPYEADIGLSFVNHCPLRDVQEAACHADPRTAMRYDRARTSLDRHATYIVAAFIAGAAR